VGSRRLCHAPQAARSMRLPRLRLGLLACWCAYASDAVPQFVTDLEYCIKNHAYRLAETFPEWGNKCDAVTGKVDYQAKLYEETLTPIMDKWGYTGALWCAMYSLGMVPIVDATQPLCILLDWLRPGLGGEDTITSMYVLPPYGQEFRLPRQLLLL